MKDRSDEIEARKIINKKLPDLDIRQKCLSILADAICHANQEACNQWAVTVSNSNGVRLVIGHYITITIHSEGLWLALDKGHYASLQASKQKSFGLFRKAWEPDELGKKGSYPFYQNRARDHFSINGFFRLETADRDSLSIVKQLLFEFINNAVESGQRIVPRSKSAHSSGIIKYLRNALKRTIPDPGY